MESVFWKHVTKFNLPYTPPMRYDLRFHKNFELEIL